MKNESCLKAGSETLRLIKSPETASQVSGQKGIEGKSEWYRVYDRLGRIVLEGNGFKANNKISTNALTSGIYKILLLSDHGTESSTFEVVR